MESSKNNSYYILLAIFIIMIVCAYMFDKGEILGRALAK